MQKFFLQIALGVLQGLRFIGVGLTRFFASGVFTPIRFGARLAFRGVLLPSYRLYLIGAKQTNRLFLPAKDRFLFPLTHRYIVHTLLILVALLVIVDSLNAKATKADAGLEPTSAIAELVPPADETSEDVVEGPIRRSPTLSPFGLPTVTPEPGQRLLEPLATTGLAAGFNGESAVAADSGTESAIRQGNEEYIVEGGDTISTIARKFGVSTNTLLWANKLDETAIIKPGDKLTILPVSGVSHEVKSGETLEKIVSKYNGDLRQTMDFNRLADASDIHAGDVLIVPGGELPTPVAPPSRAPRSQIGFSPFNIPPPSGQAGGNFLWPTTGRRINQYFRFRHTGIDIDGEYTSPIYASRDGVVSYVSYQRYGYGYHVIVDHGRGIQTLYSHASKIFVKPGQTVKRGQTIAMVGSTGRSSGTHVHFEIIVGGRKVNPLSYL